MPHSHHSHSGQFCKHAAGTLEQVVLQAIQQRFEMYGLTEHVPRYRTQDLYPEEVSLVLPVLAFSYFICLYGSQILQAGISSDFLQAQFHAFLDEAHRLKTKYADQIALLVGLETEYISEVDLAALADLLQKSEGRIEYIVGSIHHVAGIPIDFDQPTYIKSLNTFSPSSSDPESTQEANKLSAFLCAYFDAQYELIRRFHPELIGHFDLCRLYNPTLRFADYPAVLERITRNVNFAVEYGALFELNAAAFRKGWDAPYPGEDVVEIILRAGGRFALSDDSHGSHAVGLNYNRLLQYARRLGITELWLLEKSESLNSGGRRVAARKIEHWMEHSFWRRLEIANNS